MQANCPQCGQRLTVDDARAPERAFAVRCPKCQGTVRFPGRAEAGATPPPAATAPAAADAASASTADLARMRRELTLAESSRQVLVGVPDAALATALARPLAHLGYTVETLDTAEEGGRLLEQGVFDVVIISPSFAVTGSKGETVYQRITRLSPDARRPLFLVLVDDKFTTGDGTQAWAMQADLVVNPRDAPSVEPVLLNTIAERRRLYQAYQDARRRLEQAD